MNAVAMVESCMIHQCDDSVMFPIENGPDHDCNRLTYSRIPPADKGINFQWEE